MTDLILKKRICRPVYNCNKFKASCLNPKFLTIFSPALEYGHTCRNGLVLLYTRSLYYNRKNSRCDVRDIQGRVVWCERYLGTRNKYARLGGGGGGGGGGEGGLR